MGKECTRRKVIISITLLFNSKFVSVSMIIVVLFIFSLSSARDSCSMQLSFRDVYCSLLHAMSHAISYFQIKDKYDFHFIYETIHQHRSKFVGNHHFSLTATVYFLMEYFIVDSVSFEMRNERIIVKIRKLIEPLKAAICACVSISLSNHFHSVSGTVSLICVYWNNGELATFFKHHNRLTSIIIIRILISNQR